MLLRRVIPCLDVANGRVVKGTRFVDLVDEGDPAELAERYAREGADEIVFLDISAAPEGRGPLLDVVRRTAQRVFIPLTVGGGVRSEDEMGAVLRAGADKVSFNTAAVADPTLISRCAARFGRQAVVVAIDALAVTSGSAVTPALTTTSPRSWEVIVKGGREPTGLNVVAWARGAGRHPGDRRGPLPLPLTRPSVAQGRNERQRPSPHRPRHRLRRRCATRHGRTRRADLSSGHPQLLRS